MWTLLTYLFYFASFSYDTRARTPLFLTSSWLAGDSSTRTTQGSSATFIGLARKRPLRSVAISRAQTAAGQHPNRPSQNTDSKGVPSITPTLSGQSLTSR